MTPLSRPPSNYWNVFATVLQSMLEAQDPARGLGHLDNRPDPLTGKTIHPQKVARLQRSLRQPIFPTLNPEEIERVARAFDLSLDQKVRLHAAVLATAVQTMLAGRIGPHDARLAGWQILPIIEQQLRTHGDDDEGLGAARDLQWVQDRTSSSDVDDFTAEYGVALAEIDRGILALALAEHTELPRERHMSAQIAQQAFEAALDLLAPTAQENDEEREAGHFWQEEAQRGLDAVQRLKG